jgi:cytochrome c5
MRNSLFAVATLLALAVPTTITVAADQPKAMPSTTASPNMTKGKAVYDLWCLGCHAPLTGMGMFPPAGSYRLQERYKGTVPAALEERTDLTGEFIRVVVRQGMNMMPATRKTEITDAELNAVIAYLTQEKRK